MYNLEIRKMNNNIYIDALNEIHNQHENLMSLSNDLLKDISNGLPHNELFGKLDNLTKQYVVHFKFEERIMHQENYFDLVGHRQAHEKFLTMIEKLRAQLAEPNSVYEFTEYVNLITTFAKEHIGLENDVMKFFLCHIEHKPESL
jgi:hemerythrin-like metal-binding protein